MGMLAEKTNRYRQIIQELLGWLAAIPHLESGIQDRTLFDQTHDSYAVISEGWNGDERIHQVVAHLEITDNGVGFVEQADSQRFGLHTMRERAQQVGGKLSISSRVGQGTTVICELPEVDQANLMHLSPAALPERG